MEKIFANAQFIFENPLARNVLLIYLIFATYTDIKYMKIYNKFNLSLVLVRVAFIFLPIYAIEFKIENIIASVSIFLFLLIVGMIFMHQMGGDIKFLSAFMMFFDFYFMITFMAIASLLNLMYFAVLGVCVFVKKYLNKKYLNKETKNKLTIYLMEAAISPTEKIENAIDSINKSEVKKYKAPFAPFFLLSYIIMWAMYFCF